MRQSKLHFEQIPVEVVKKMIAEAAENKKAPHAEISKENLSAGGPDTTGLGEAELQIAGSFAIGTDASDLRYPDWQRPLREALLELDPARLRARVDAAESAMFARLQVISQDGAHHPERLAIEDGLSSLRVVKRETLAS